MISPLLALCARTAEHPTQQQSLREAAGQFTQWADLPNLAEEHGIAPLLYHHLGAIEFSPPPPTRRALQGLVLRHRQANAIRSRVLSQILTAFQAEGIAILVLKGAALAHVVYPQPGLRPMRDIDLLARPAEAERAQTLLTGLGFREAKIGKPLPPAHHHLPPVKKVVEGLTVTLELHHRLLPHTGRHPSFDRLWNSAVSFSVNGTKAYTLSPADMLWHIYRHSFALPLIVEPLRLIWVADFVSLVEKFADQIDWPALQRRYPQLWRVLPLFHFLTPWSETVQRRLKLSLEPAPQGVGQLFQGWPQASLAVQRTNKGWGKILRDTLWPSAWWMQLYYGTSGRGPVWWWHRTVRHPLHILGWVGRYLQDR